MQTMAVNREDYSQSKQKQLWLERILYEWGVWKATGGLAEFHVRSRSIGENFTHYGETDYQPHLIFMSRMTDAVINDLKPLERQAIYCEYLKAKSGKEIPWTSNLPIGPILVMAHESVRMGLRRKGYEWS